MLLRMDGQPGRRYFILAIWSQPNGGAVDVWRGYVETPNGTRTYFATLDRLNELLQAMGWRQEAMLPGQSNYKNLDKME